MTDRLISPSEIVTKALGYKPDGVPAKQACVCAYCGHAIGVGEIRVPFTTGQSFMDEHYLAAKGSHDVCGWCVPLLSPEGLRASGHGVFGPDGFMPFRKWRDIASAVMEPPRTPFVMVHATANNQHMAWRAPVNYARDLYRVRVGLRDLLIRRPVLEEAVELCRVLGESPRVVGERATTRNVKVPKSKAAKTLPNPFAYLSPDLKDARHGTLTAAVANLRSDPGITSKEQAALAFVQRLTLGETWALRFVLTPGAGE